MTRSSEEPIIRSPVEAPLARPDELHERLHVRLVRQLGIDALEGLSRVELRLEQEPVCPLESLQPLPREAAACQADPVETVGLGIYPIGSTEGKHVLAQLRVGADEGEPADADELMCSDEGP